MYQPTKEDMAFVMRTIKFEASRRYRRFHGAFNYDDFAEVGHDAFIEAWCKARNQRHFRNSFFVRARARMAGVVREWEKWKNGKAPGFARKHHRVPRISPRLTPALNPYTRRRLYYAWQTLSPEEQAAVIACWIDGLPANRYAKEIGKSHKYVQNRLDKTRKRFIYELRRYYGTGRAGN